MNTMNLLSNMPPSPDDALRAGLRRDMSAWGVPSDLAERLLADHAPERVRQQLDWLPLRNAHDPARLLVAAIQKDYAPPASVLKRQALEQALHNLAEKAEETPRDISEAPTDLPLP